MILASVGTLLPFERFVRAVDEWAGAHPAQPVFLQIGEGLYEPRHAPYARVLPMAEYRERLRGCDLLVAHAGIGSILQALAERKPALLMPRRASLGEHTTDHQLDTVARFGETPGVVVADTAEALKAAMSRLSIAPPPVDQAISPSASTSLLDAVAGFLDRAKPSS